MARRYPAPKRKNAPDATLRNVRAAKKRTVSLEARLGDLIAAINDLRVRVGWLEEHGMVRVNAPVPVRPTPSTRTL